MKPHLAITMGDPAGIGPEIIVKACQKLRGRLGAGELGGLLVIGSNSALQAARAQLGAAVDIPETTEDADWPPLACLQAGPEQGPIELGVVSAAGGRLAYLAVERGCGWRRPAAFKASSRHRSTRRP